MRFLAMVFTVVSIAATPGFAQQQACGPIVRCLEGNYFLVQCNGVQLQANDQISVFRAGREIGRGKVMRVEGNVCSVQVPGGVAQRMDVVYLLPAAGEAARGPALPSTYGRAGGGQPLANASSEAPAATTKTKRDDFFGRLEGGRVLNLNTGEFSTSR